MVQKLIFNELHRNKDVFNYLLNDLSEEEYSWSQEDGKWCLLEIVCHLYDEEREDFRMRVKCVLENPDIPPPPFDPIAWVTERNYMSQDYKQVLEKFLDEREESVMWLNSIINPSWDNTYNHPKIGPMGANLFLSNWLAHDFLHIRQIIKLKFDYLKEISGEPLKYAGNW